MRLLIYARAQEAVPLYAVIKLGIAPNVGLLMGGMLPYQIERQIERFEADPNGILIATAAYAHNWHTDAEAMVIFCEDSFVGDKWSAAMRVQEPSFEPPTPDQLLELINRSSDRPPEADDEEAEPLKELPAPCEIRARQESDEYVCTRCPLRWDIHEPRPPCLKGRQ